MSIEEMTHDDIIRMAREAGFKLRHNAPREWWMLTEDIEHFAALVAAAEREACANVAARISDKYAFGFYGNEVDTADEIAAAIRERMK